MTGLNLEQWAELSGYLASFLVFVTFCMKTLIPLRIAAIMSNVAFIAYGIGAGLMPILVLHVALLPLNLWRTAQQLRMMAEVRRAAMGNIAIDVLLPHMTRRRMVQGEVLFRLGDIASAMYYVEDGEILLPEIGKTIGPGQLLGEVGLFASDNRRTLSAICSKGGKLLVLNAETMKGLFHRDPAFGFYMTRLIATRLSENQKTLMETTVKLGGPIAVTASADQDDSPPDRLAKIGKT